MPVVFLRDSAVVDNNDVYAGFLRKFAHEVPTKSHKVRLEWKRRTDDGHLRYMRQFRLVDTDTGAQHVCTTAFSLGSSGILFKYGTNACDRPIYCVKLIPHTWTAPVGMARCRAIVQHRVCAAGRVQVMPHARRDLWSLAQSTKRAWLDGSIDEKLHEVKRFRRVSYFLAAAVVELFTNDVVMTDMKMENVIVDGDGMEETYSLCDLESFSELDGSSTHPTRCTFEPCARCAKLGVLTTAFAAVCTAVDFANGLVDSAAEVSFKWCDPKTSRPDVFSLSHPFVLSVSKHNNEYIDAWAWAAGALARHRAWGNHEKDKVFALWVFERVKKSTARQLALLCHP